MPEQIQDDTAALLAPMLKKTLFVAISRAVASAEAIRPFIADHLRYMNALEERGALFASGPFVQPGVVVGDGLSILNTRDEAEARRWMDDEPLIKRGLRTYDLRQWELREGRITVALSLSRSAFDLP
ncbi:MAG: YciI family protein [Rhodopila sp.]|jgi:uncharacterized protein YciI